MKAIPYVLLLKRARYNASKKLNTEVMIVSLPKKGSIKVMKMPGGNSE